MKLKSLKFVLPILLVLPSFAFAGIYYVDYYFHVSGAQEETINIPSGTKATQISLMEKPTCMDTIYPPRLWIDIWKGNYEQQLDSWYTNIPQGYTLDLDIEGENFLKLSFYDQSPECFEYDVTITIMYETIETPPSPPPSPPPSGTIGNTQNWLSSNEILAYIGKLAEDIPNYIALMIGLPIAFWFVEKIIAFVRGNFRPVEKIKEK
jgi:hypothetical protein